MEPIPQIQFKNLSLDDKIHLVQSLWDEIADETSIAALPREHKKVLIDRLNKANSNDAVFISWDEVKLRYYNML